LFNGKPEYIQVDIDRFINHKRNIYDKQWNLCDFSIGFPRAEMIKIKKPDCLERMLLLAENLGKDFLHVRVDFYCIPQIYFGEITFTHGSGGEKFAPRHYNKLLGDMWRL
jgi:hypothetical protein